MAEPETDLVQEGKTRQDRQDREDTTRREDKTGQTGQGRHDTANREDTTKEKTEQPVMSSGSWPGPIALLQEAWQIYKKRFWTFMGISLIPFLAITALALALGLLGAIGGLIGLANSVAAIVLLVMLATVAVAAAIIIMAWSQITMLIAVGSTENLGIKEYYRQGWARIYQFIWVGAISGLVVLGGIFLLLVPGIIFSYWFFFALMVVAFENGRGMDALQKSRDYVRGHWWGVVGRSLFISLIFFAISAALGAIGLGSLGNVATFVLSPLMVAYTYLMYRHAKQTAQPAGGSDKKTFVAIAIFGVIASIVLVAALFVGAVALSDSGLLKDLMNSASTTGAGSY